VRKLILKNGFATGDVVMMTAAVRDLHAGYPGQFLTDVRTACPELWEHNPHLTPLAEGAPDVEVLDCHYPLIDQCNWTPYHCLHGFIAFLNERLGLQIKPTAFKGDIHLSDLEKSWYSQVYELAGEEIPFWIVAAGGKYDITIKWWSAERYQKVVDHFRGRIQFVQVGAPGHHHPRLEGVIDLRGQTTLRELVRLVFHAQGVLCPVTALMHLAAAVEVKQGRPPNRPCVVVAGGREPAHWEAYPDHQFIHTNGALRCCAGGGCWKSRVAPLGDGDERDHPDQLCVDVVEGLPRCLNMITAEEVIRRIEFYFQGGALPYLSARQFKAARCAVKATASHPFDEEPLNLHNARMACERFIPTIPDYPGGCRGRGLVICAGGARYFTNAWVCLHQLRRLGCSLPIQLWYRGSEELDARMRSLVEPLGVACVDAQAVRRKHPVRLLGGWELKPYAILHCPFREVLLLDADNVPVVNPDFLFDTPQFRKTGAVFWPDWGPRGEKTRVIWQSCGLTPPQGPEVESGQMLVDKKKCWRALRLCLWFNEHSDFYYQHLHGDKETFPLAFEKLNQPYALVPQPLRDLEDTMCQHDFAGNRIFQHRNMAKWNLFLPNKRVKGFWFEEECRADVARLRQLWDGAVTAYRKRLAPSKRGARGPKSLSLHGHVITGPARRSLCQQTLRNLAKTDWAEEPSVVCAGPHTAADGIGWPAAAVHAALTQSLSSPAQYHLFLTDDLTFNLHLRHNLLHWAPLKNGAVTLAGLYNPNLIELSYDFPHHAFIVEPKSIYAAQALLLSKPALKFVLQHWDEVEGQAHRKIVHLAARLDNPILFHTPSLVQRLNGKKRPAEDAHQAVDFDPNWKA
jgi:ADP-heptose:LPS heptosyltransferase